MFTLIVVLVFVAAVLALASMAGYKTPPLALAVILLCIVELIRSLPVGS